MRIVFALAFIAAIAYGTSELRRWRTPEMRGLLTAKRRAMRIVSYVALLTVIGMAFGGTYLPVHHISKLTAVHELFYWCVCLVVAAIIPIVAIREFRATLSQQSLKEASAERDAALHAAVEAFQEAEHLAKRREEMPGRNGHG